jgi:hypothetical protein
MINFCTLFDSNYLARGLALHESLNAVCPSYQLYVVAFDDACYEYLSQARLPNLTPISLKSFEDEALLGVKPTRSAAEYCWTCTPSVILYCIEKYNLEGCTYIDADMIFYEDPSLLFEEANGNSIIITPHWYSKDYDVSASHGIYCVEFMFFKNDSRGMQALRWWRARCIEWCYARQEDNKFGDQKYLDDWTSRFEGVHVVQNRGAGVAPWNLQQFNFSGLEKHPELFEHLTKKKLPLIFFHFHGLKFYNNNKVSLTGTMFEMDEQVKKLIYFPYVQRLLDIQQRLTQQGVGFNSNGARTPSPLRLSIFAGFLKERLILLTRGKISILNPEKFNLKKYFHYHTLNDTKQ